MNLSLPTVIIFTTGIVLIYAAVKNQDPRDVIRVALGQKPIYSLDGEALGKAAGKAASDAAKLLQPSASPINHPAGWVSV